MHLVFPLRTPNFPPGTHEYDPKRYTLKERARKCMLSRGSGQIRDDEVYTDESMIKTVGAVVVINRHFQTLETTCFRMAAPSVLLRLQPSPWHMDLVQPDVVIYSDSMSCLKAIEGKDTEHPPICHIMNLLWALRDL